MNSRTHRLFAWIWALAKTLSGIGLFCLAANQTLVVAPLVRGWLGMIGVVLFLHFGIFELLALWWRREGVPVESLMRSPWRATSLAEFWGKRWNTAFHILAHEFAFKPLARQWGAGTGTLGLFFISGLIHDAVISLPARAGFGLPTAYFLAQAAGVLVERSQWGRLIGLGRGVPGWLFTMVCTAAPAFWLFHPQFVLNVIVPMLNAVATKVKGKLMKTATLVFLLQIASILHVGLVCAGASMPRAVGLKERLAILPPFIRRLFFVYFMFIGLVLIGFGTLTFCFAGAMVEGEPLARALCGLMLALWILRLVAAAFIFDVRPYLTNWFYRAGYQATNAVFVYLVLIYLLTIWKGGKLM